MISACDIRISTKDAKFSIGETKLGLVADVGILQRMPKIVSKGDLRELAYTGKVFDGDYAEKKISCFIKAKETILNIQEEYLCSALFSVQV